ncbi:MAG TPA: CPBP family glutamic-type intramembrane protease [Roseiflexaceae bacterium]|nr:CPBP family glutamic-type intramembrane protease [Roseiflexaceae bacterium]
MALVSNTPVTLRRLGLFLALFFAVWTLRVVALSPLINPSRPALWQDLAGIAVKLLLWVAPVWLIIAWSEGLDPADALRLRSRAAAGWLWGLAVGIAYLAATVLLAVVLDGAQVRAGALATLPRTFVGAALPEEILFRGYVLRQLEHALPFWQANLLTALLFLAAHLPGWAYFGGGSLAVAVAVFVVGVVCGALVRHSGSLWSAVAFHTLNNLAAALIA